MRCPLTTSLLLLHGTYHYATATATSAAVTMTLDFPANMGIRGPVTVDRALFLTHYGIDLSSTVPPRTPLRW